MIYCMSTIRRTTEYVNPGQIPVMVADPPLYTLSKRLQWKFCDTDIAEDKFLIMPGVMRTEEMLWTPSGDWLDHSNTKTAVATSGSAQSFIGAAHICRTWWGLRQDRDKTGRRAAQIPCIFHCKSSLGSYQSSASVANGFVNVSELYNPSPPCVDVRAFAPQTVNKECFVELCVARLMHTSILNDANIWTPGETLVTNQLMGNLEPRVWETEFEHYNSWVFFFTNVNNYW